MQMNRAALYHGIGSIQIERRGGGRRMKRKSEPGRVYRTMVTSSSTSFNFTNTFDLREIGSLECINAWLWNFGLMGLAIPNSYICHFTLNIMPRDSKGCQDIQPYNVLLF